MRKVMMNLPSAFCRPARRVRVGKLPRGLTQVDD
jgi:hypothetical protein